jgi:hypothetical protein
MRRMDERRAFMLALIAIATVAAAGACGSSGGKPAAQATRAASTQPTTTQAVSTTRPSAPAQKFVSERYGFRITLTADWSEADALVDWNGTELQGLASPAWARFTDPAAGLTLVAAAARAAKGTQLAEWQAAMVRAAPAVCSDSSSVEKTTLGGEPALAWTATCSDGDANKLAALHGKRGYMILLGSLTVNDDAEDRRRIFESIRRSFRFTR